MDKVIIITGPTAVGKTKCSIEVAKHFNTEIINGDAYQIYKHMNIGTAKPSCEEMKQVNHHLIDFIDPKETFSVADYQRIVRSKIAEFNKNNIILIRINKKAEYFIKKLIKIKYS